MSWQKGLTGRQVLRVHRQVAENNGGDTRHLSRAEFNAQLAEVRAELFDVVSVAVATPVELGGVL